MNIGNLKMWCWSVGLKADILEDEAVKLWLSESDGVSALRRIQRICSESPSAYKIPNQELENLFSPQIQIEFLYFVNN